MNDEKNCKDNQNTLYLSIHEITILNMYIRMSTNHREREKEAWLKLAAEKNDDGTIKFKNAEGNVQFWEDVEKTLQDILNKL